MILLLLLSLGLVVAVIRGGSFRNLGMLHVRHAWIPLVAFGLQAGFLLFTPQAVSIPTWMRTAIVIVTYGGMISFLLLNLTLPGSRLLLVGAAFNAAVMSANYGFMPVTPEALARAGHTGYIVSQGSESFVRRSKDIVLERGDTRLWWLSDVFGIPAPLPFSSNFSLGDLLIGLGAAWLVHRGMTRSAGASAGHSAASEEPPRKGDDHGPGNSEQDDRPGADRPPLSRRAAEESA